MRVSFDERHLGVLRVLGSGEEHRARLSLRLRASVGGALLGGPRFDAAGTLEAAPLGGAVSVKGEVWLEWGVLRYALRVDAESPRALRVDARKAGFRHDPIAAISTLGGVVLDEAGTPWGALMLRFDPRDELRASLRSLRLEP